MHNFVHLNWDSDFFNRKIGKIIFSSNGRIEELIKSLEKAKLMNYDLIYVFSDPDFVIEDEILQRFNGNLIDTKLKYHRRIPSEISSFNLKVSIFDSKIPTADLINLALTSGDYSRFQKDKRFTESDFIRLYTTWLIKSITKEIADEVFVYIENDKILGFITLSIKNSRGEVGLFAVFKDAQGKGIGTKLLVKVYKYLLDHKIDQLYIPTQKENIPACRFYAKKGFHIISEQSIYHFL